MTFLKKTPLSVIPIQTRVLHLGEALLPFLESSLRAEFPDPQTLEGTVLAITSKVVSIADRRVIPTSEIEKEALVRRESDHFLGEIGFGCYLTIKNGLFIPSAGIDESNAEGDFYILYPENPTARARALRDEIANLFGLKKFGVLLTDSHTTPLRAGVTGITLAHAGFRAVKNQIGTPDIFGKPLQMTRVNVADALSVAAVFCMGEAAETAPLAVIRADVEFIDAVDEKTEECSIPVEYDLYFPLYKDALALSQRK